MTGTSVTSMSPEQKKQLYEEFGIWERGFTLGVINYTVTIATALRFPQYYWILHLFKAFVYLPWRFVRFRKKNWEWLMADFCYVNTYLSVIGCLAAFIRITTGYESPLHRYNYGLMRGGFAFANGALALAVPLYGNKLVFHDVDNLASVYIHTSPGLLMWTLRWGGGFGTSLIESTWPDMFDVCHDMQQGDAALENIRSMFWHTVQKTPDYNSWDAFFRRLAGGWFDLRTTSSCEGDVWQFVVYPAVCWLVVWGIPYYLIVLCLLKDYLASNEKETLYSFTIQDTRGNGRLINKLPNPIRPLGYMMQHFVFTVSTSFCSLLMWNSFILHTLFLVAIGLKALHNGSTYMFRVVAARHVQGVVQEVAENYGADL